MASAQVGPSSSSASSPYAGVGSRLLAFLIDLLISLALVFAVGFTFRFLRSAGIVTAHESDPAAQWMGLSAGAKLLVFSAFVVSTGAIYLVLMECSPWQATFGKRITNIFVTDDNGVRITPLRSFGRWLGKYCFAWFGGSLVSIVTVAATERHKALHDMTARTVVVNGRSSAALEPWRVFAVFAVPYFWLFITFYVTLF